MNEADTQVDIRTSEGKAKFVKRRAYGYKSFTNYRLRLLNACA
jgi:transposase